MIILWHTRFLRFIRGFIIILPFINSIALAETSSPQTKTLLMWGDSLSAAYGISVEKGWVNLLQAKLGDKFKIINGSISGETTSGGLTRLPEALNTHKPDYVVIELGANDGLRGLPTTEMQANLEQMIKLSQAAKAKVILIGIYMPANYGTVYTKRFAQVYLDLAKQYELPLMPFLLEGVALNPDLIQADGLHPNEKAQSIILDNVWKTLEPVLTHATASQ